MDHILYKKIYLTRNKIFCCLATYSTYSREHLTTFGIPEFVQRNTASITSASSPGIFVNNVEQASLRDMWPEAWWFEWPGALPKPNGCTLLIWSYYLKIYLLRSKFCQTITQFCTQQYLFSVSNPQLSDAYVAWSIMLFFKKVTSYFSF